MATTQTSTLPAGGSLFAPKPASSAAPKPTERVRPYKDFLTPALHRRFTQAALVILNVCYLCSITISWPGIFWLWNPISFTGARTLLLFMPCLAVFIIRVANMHIGAPTTAFSPAEGVYSTITSWKALHTLAWYIYSACFFGEIYIWSQAGGTLAWIDPGRAYERARLNENPIFLRSELFCLAIVQTAVHLARGDDQIPIPEREEKDISTANPASGPQQQQTAQPPSSSIRKPAQELINRLGTGDTAKRIAVRLVPTIPSAFAIYLLFLRGLLWPWFYAVGRVFFRQLPPSAPPSGFIHFSSLLADTFWASLLLICLWELSNVAFTVFVSQPPLKRDQPLTSEIKDAHGVVVSKSKDPNGTLLSGLKSKKEVPKAFAFRELWLICSQFEARRKTIYGEVDRAAGGSTWSQISKCCLDEISAIQTRIKDSQAPAEQRADTTAKEIQRRQQENLLPPQSQDSLGMPRIADREVVQNGAVLAKSKAGGDIAHQIGDLAKSIGQSPGATSPLVRPTKRAIEWSADHLLSKEERARLSTKAGIEQEFANGTVMRFLRTPAGEFFRESFARRVRGVVFGTPYSSYNNIVHASRSLSLLCAKSLKEDNYGQVAQSIPTVVRTYVSAITSIQAFVANLQPHWTDVYFNPRQDRKVPEVEAVVEVLKQGLEEVVLAFGEYASAIGLSKKELREARDVIGTRREVQHVAAT